ncbi:hypothetical protein [Enterovirga rhinocerotis]|uniref:hypothetical protein n=1 Tax=Enterovirga rhinocerotis TaxID=1339210 RepID=UPI00105C0226|nr:hypothetical protein [Enterovirga rhinocerotis]
MPARPVTARLLLAWQALSPFGFGLGFSGLALLAVATLGLVTLPAWLSRPAIVAGAALLAAGLLYQTAYGRATLEAALRAERQAAAAEQLRAERAEAITHDLEARASRDRAALADSRRQLQDLLHALETDPGRDRVCLPDDVARGLRRL